MTRSRERCRCSGSWAIGVSGRGPDFFDGMWALGWADNYTPIGLAGLINDGSMADAGRALVA